MFKTLFLSLWFSFHPVHVTLTSIDYIAEMDYYKVFVRMYFDDFLLDCKINNLNTKNDDFSDNKSESKDVMQKYIDEKIIIKVNDKQLTGKLLDMNLADNEISMNLKYVSVKKPKVITVKNFIMTDLHSDQSNMIIVKVKDFEEGIKLTSDLTEQTFKIK
jgi:hypothetical protein